MDLLLVAGAFRLVPRSLGCRARMPSGHPRALHLIGGRPVTMGRPSAASPAAAKARTRTELRRRRGSASSAGPRSSAERAPAGRYRADGADQQPHLIAGKGIHRGGRGLQLLAALVRLGPVGGRQRRRQHILHLAHVTLGLAPFPVMGQHARSAAPPSRAARSPKRSDPAAEPPRDP